MFEDPLDDHRVFDTGNDFHAPTTVPAGLYVDPEYALQTPGPGHGGVSLRRRLARVPMRVPGAAARCHQRPQTAIGREYPVEAREVHTRFWYERRQARDEIQWLEDYVRGASALAEIRFGTPFLPYARWGETRTSRYPFFLLPRRAFLPQR